MAKIAVIGAGSVGWTRSLVRDILTFPALKDCTLALMDIDKERLGYAEKTAKLLAGKLGVRPRIQATLSRKTALTGADAVICTILSGGVDVWRHDIEIPKKYGIDTNIGDTRSVSGVFRALRTIPVMLDICRDMERYCPEALLLNYTNPMSMLCRAMQRASRIQLTGLCHSVQGTAHDLAGMIGAPMKEISFLCAGINHQAWFLEVKWKGKDAYPLVRKAITSSRKIYYKDAVRNEMFLHLDYYVTESSGHNSEYNWWFRKRPDLIKKYCVGTGWNPGEYAISVKKYPKNRNIWRKDVQKWFAKGGPISLERGHEFATYIINSLVTDEPYIFNGSVANKGLITNLPPDASVEVPVLATKRGLQSIHVGALPAQCAALNNASLAVEEMAVEAALTGDPRLVMQSILYDPLCASVLSMAEIRKMVREMLRKNRPYLPQFKSVEV